MANTRTPHILFIRLSSMGDVAMTVPVVVAFRESNPGVKISVLTRPFFQPFFRGIPQIDFIVPDLDGRHKGMAGIVRLWRDVAAHDITHVADLHDVLRTKILRCLLRLSGMKVSVIDKGRAEKRALTRKCNKIKIQLEHTVARYRDTVLRLGLACAEPVPAVRTAAQIPDVVGEAAGEKQGRWIGVAPFAKHKGKIYPAALCDTLIGMLAAQYGRVFLFGGGKYEKAFAEEMESRYQGVVSVIGKLTLDQELDLISNIDMMVTMDSAAMHMASIVGTPAVSIWGATHPMAGFMGFGQDPERAVQLDMACRPCSIYGDRPCIYNDYRCLERLEPETVADAVEKALESIKK